MISTTDGVTRLDDEGLAALLACAAGRDLDPVTAQQLAGAAAPDLEVVRRPVVTVEVVVAGGPRLHHRVWVGRERAVAVLAVRAGLHQLMVLPPSHLAAALVRMTGIGPRRVAGRESRAVAPDTLTRLLGEDADRRRSALRDVRAAVAWQLRVVWAGEERDLGVVDGQDGLYVVDEDAGALRPVSASSLYRVFATALPPAALDDAG